MKRIFTFLFCLVMSIGGYAQWEIKNFSDGEFLYDLDFSLDQYGVAVGENYIYTTSDTGETWTRKPFLVGHQLSRVNVFSSNVLFALSSDINLRDRTYFSISSDLGESWDTTILVSDQSYYEMAFLTQTEGLIFGSGGILKTSDGGLNWKSVHKFDSRIDLTQIYDVSLTANQAGYLTGSFLRAGTPSTSYILATYNRGENWQLLNEASILDAFIGLACPDDSTCIGIRDDEEVLVSRDSTRNWQIAKSCMDCQGGLASLFYVNDSLIYGCGSNTAVIGAPPSFSFWKSVDAGDTWSILDTIGLGLTDVYFIDKYTGFVVGEEGLIMKTKNCGGKLPEDYPWHKIISSIKTSHQPGNYAVTVHQNGIKVSCLLSNCGPIEFRLYDPYGRALIHQLVRHTEETIPIKFGAESIYLWTISDPDAGSPHTQGKIYFKN